MKGIRPATNAFRVVTCICRKHDLQRTVDSLFVDCPSLSFKQHQQSTIQMAGSKSTAGASGRVQKKAPSKTSKPSSNSNKSAGSAKSLYSGTAEGVTQLPVARVKRIIKEDKDVQMVSNDAVFLISLATVRLCLSSFFLSFHAVGWNYGCFAELLRSK